MRFARSLSLTAMTLGLVVALPSPTIAVPPVDRPSSAPIALTGSVVRDGRGIAADIVVVAWPHQDFLAALPEGEVVPLVTVAAVRSRPSGSYSVPIDPTSLPPDYLNSDGQLDLEIAVADSTSQMVWHTSARASRNQQGGRSWIDTRGSQRVGAADVAAATPMLTFDLGTGLVRDAAAPLETIVDTDFRPLTELAARQASSTAVTPRQLALDTSVEAGRTALASNSVVPMSNVGPICSTYKRGLIYGNTEYFTHVQGASFANVRVTQGYDSTHTLGVGVNSGAGWAASGSATIKLGASGTTPGYTDARRIANKVNYREYDNDCTTRPVDSIRPESVHTILSAATYTTRRTYSYACVTYAAGQTFTKTRGTNLTVSNGVSTPYLTLNAQSGHNTLSSSTYTWTGRGRLCASSSVGTVTAPAVGTMY